MIPALAWRAEEACLNAWPGLRQVIHGDWLLRFADGMSRRANSVNPLRMDVTSIARDVAAFQELYRAQELPLIVRVPSFLDPEVGHELERLHFTSEGETCTIHGEFAMAAVKTDTDIEVLSQASESWFSAMSKLQKHTPAQTEIYRRVIGHIALPAGFATLRKDGEIVAVAYGAVHDGLLCCESVIVDARMRGQGCGRRLMATLFAWAQGRGATGACLQVEASNVAGRALYRSIGLTTELHRYNYRRQPAG
jgi:ribosomal protein S18 acetylase RimI-like enzyme